MFPDNSLVFFSTIKNKLDKKKFFNPMIENPNKTSRIYLLKIVCMYGNHIISENWPVMDTLNFN